MTTTREKRLLNAEAPRTPVLVSTAGLVAVIPSAARDLQFLSNAALRKTQQFRTVGARHAVPARATRSTWPSN